MTIDTQAAFPLLSLLTFSPLVGVVLVSFVPRDQKGLLRHLALGTSLVTFLIAAVVYARFDGASAGFQWVESVPWVAAGVSFTLGIDGLSLLLVMLTAFLTPIVFLSITNAIEHRLKEFLVALLVLETGMLGTLLALDLFLFYVFWESMLIPMFLIIGVWGGKRRIYAAVKFVLFTMVGSLLMLVAILYLYLKAGSAHLVDVAGLDLTTTEQLWLFGAFGLAFAIKVPIFPLHTWLPDAHVEAPTAGSVILAGVLLKMGTYGFIRFAIPLFPTAAGLLSFPLVLLAALGIVYGALMAWAQTDIKKLVAYSSVSHLGFVMLGMVAFTVAGLSGSVLQMVNHGISTGALFLMVGMLYERRHTRDIAAYGGLARVMPAFATVFLIVTLSSIGLPGTNGFVGEFLILAGALEDALTHYLNPPLVASGYHVVATVALALVSLGAVFALARRVVHRPRDRRPTAGGFLRFALLAGLAAGAIVAAAALRGVPLPSLLDWRVFLTLMTGLAASGVVLGAVYMLSLVRRVFFGPVTNPANEGLADLSRREWAVMLPLVALIFAIGLFPNAFLDKTKASIDRLVFEHQPALMAERAPYTYERRKGRFDEERARRASGIADPPAAAGPRLVVDERGGVQGLRIEGPIEWHPVDDADSALEPPTPQGGR